MTYLYTDSGKAWVFLDSDLDDEELATLVDPYCLERSLLPGKSFSSECVECSSEAVHLSTDGTQWCNRHAPSDEYCK